MAILELELKKTKETKNKIVYGDGNVDDPIQSVYINKNALPSPAPDLISVVITDANDR